MLNIRNTNGSAAMAFYCYVGWWLAFVMNFKVNVDALIRTEILAKDHANLNAEMMMI